jgi:NADPH:quinone reductase-like Zn-dependent oxidoreductase
LVDYREADWPEQVRRLAGGDGVDFAYDAISEGETVKKVASTLKEGGRMAIVRSRQGRAWAASEEGLTVEPIYGAVWEGLGAEIQYQGFVVPASPKAKEFAAAFYKWLSQGGKLEPNPIRLMPGGLDRVVEDGFSLLGTGTMEDRGRDRKEEWMRPISAEKLVYRVRE